MKFKMDTHMHFDLYNNRNEVLDYIENNHSYTIAVTNLPDLFERSLHLCEKENSQELRWDFILNWCTSILIRYSNLTVMYLQQDI